MSSPNLTIFHLQSAAGVAARTLRRWTKSKVLPRAIGRGRGARYDEEHLLRARVIRKLRAEGCSLKEIRARLATLSRAELVACLPKEATPSVPAAASSLAPSPAEYPSTSWEVVQLGDGLALFVNPARAAARGMAEQIYRQCAAVRAAELASKG